MLRLHFFRGMGGKLTSAGVDKMARDAAARWPKEYIRIWDWDDCRYAQGRIMMHPQDDCVCLVGYSMGANAVTWIPEWYERRYDLIVGLDPTVWSWIAPFQGYVQKAICYHDLNPVNMVGHAIYSFAPVVKPERLKLKSLVKPKGTLETEDIWDLHLSVDKNPVYQREIMDAIADAIIVRTQK